MTIRCLVVDDHPITRAGTITILRRDRQVIIVGEAGECDQTLLLAAECRPNLVLLDVRLAGTLSIDIIGKLKARSPAPRVLMLSAYPDRPLVQAALAAGADGYALKSISGADLRCAVQRVMTGAQVLMGVDHVAAQTATAAPSPPISRRELEILGHASQGLSSREIAEVVETDVRTVESHLLHLYRKLHVKNRTEAVAVARARGLLPME